MSEMLLINPRRRRRKAPSAAQKRARAAFARAAKARAVRRRRRNPDDNSISMAQPRRRRRTALRAMRAVRRRRSNPAMMGGLTVRSLMSQLQAGLVSGAGAVVFDVAHGQIQRFLPAMLVPTPGAIGVGDAVKALITASIGQLLSRPTRGLSQKAAAGALTVQMHGIIRSYVPATLPLGYMSPAEVTGGSARIGPNKMVTGMGRYTAPGETPMLNRYTSPGSSPLLNAAPGSARLREGVTVY